MQESFSSQETLKPSEIITEKGSVYRYLPDGRTQRYKAITNVLNEPMDVMVFVPPWELIKDQYEK